jgi:hypothetical protein
LRFIDDELRAAEKAMAKGEQAAADMFQLFAKMLSIDPKYM